MSKQTSVVVRESDILWRGHPWVVPALVGRTIAAIAIAIVLIWLEFTFNIAFLFILSFPVLALTLVAIFSIWLVWVLELAALRASNVYILRGSSLEIRHGILGKKMFTLSAAGFSDLEVVQSVSGRMLNTGDIIMETDSRRDLRVRGIRDPEKVSAMIREVMTTPMVRIAPGLSAIEAGVQAKQES